MEFPFLKLPLLAIEEVLKSAEFSDLIHFSFTSKTSHRRVKSLKKQANRVLNILVNEFGIKISTQKEFEIGWNIYYEVEKRDRPITRVIAGFEMRTLSLDGSLFTYESWELKKCALIALNYLKDLFRCSVHSISLFPDRIPHSNSSSLNLPIKCQVMYIEGNDGLSYDKLWEILDDTEVSQYLSIDVQITGNARKSVKRWTRRNTFVSLKSQWITKEMLSDLESKTWHIYLENTKLTPEDVGYAINKWFHSRNYTLDLLILEDVIPGPDGLTFESLGLEMPLMPYDEKRRNKDFVINRTKTRDFSKAMDILRGDGLLASIRIYNRVLYFGVWGNKFVDNTGKTVLEDPPQNNNVNLNGFLVVDGFIEDF